MVKKAGRKLRKKIAGNGKPDIDLSSVRGPVTLHRFLPNDPVSWSLIPQLEQRIKNFCDEHHTDARSETLIQGVRAVFVNALPTGFMMGVLEGMVVVGHILAQFESYAEKRYILVYQAETDNVNPDGVNAIWSQLKDWAIAIEAQEIRVVTDREESFARRFGFEKMNTTMRLVLSEKKNVAEKPVVPSLN